MSVFKVDSTFRLGNENILYSLDKLHNERDEIINDKLSGAKYLVSYCLWLSMVIQAKRIILLQLYDEDKSIVF